MDVLHAFSATLGSLERTLAWYANLPEICIHIYLAGILSCETDVLEFPFYTAGFHADFVFQEHKTSFFSAPEHAS